MIGLSKNINRYENERLYIKKEINYDIPFDDMILHRM